MPEPKLGDLAQAHIQGRDVERGDGLALARAAPPSRARFARSKLVTRLARSRVPAMTAASSNASTASWAPISASRSRIAAFDLT